MGLGHEGAGIIEAVGPEVTNHKTGDRVAWGWVRSSSPLLKSSPTNVKQATGSCGECSMCRQGQIYLCEKALREYGRTDLDQGSFSTGAVWDARYVYRIPDSMDSADAAPLLCGGWTVWNALTGYDLKPTDHIGIVGIGGLGHLAIQLAAKMGCEVTAFSATSSKEKDSLALGAHHFVITKVKEGEVLKVARSIDKLIICTNTHIDWALFVPLLQGRASVFPLQIPEDMSAPLSVPHMPFLMKSLNVIYSTNGRHDAYDKLLAFAALHNVKPVVEKFPMSAMGIEESIKKLENGTMRYRGVLVV